MMQILIGAVGSKKLMLVAVAMGWIIEDAISRSGGCQWWHAMSVAILGACYAVGQGFVDAAEARAKPWTTASQASPESPAAPAARTAE